MIECNTMVHRCIWSHFTLTQDDARNILCLTCLSLQLLCIIKCVLYLLLCDIILNFLVNSIWKKYNFLWNKLTKFKVVWWNANFAMKSPLKGHYGYYIQQWWFSLIGQGNHRKQAEIVPVGGGIYDRKNAQYVGIRNTPQICSDIKVRIFLHYNYFLLDELNPI